MIDQTNSIEEKLFPTREAAGYQAEQEQLWQKLGLPGRKSEDYKYTSISRILDKGFDRNLDQGTPAWAQEECQGHFYSAANANHLVFINGSFAPDYSILSGQEAMSVEVIQADTLSSIAPHIQSPVKGIELDPFAALNGARFHTAVHLKADKNKSCTDTFIYHFIDSEEGQVASFPRIFITGLPGAKARVYEKQVTKGINPALNVSIVQAIVEPNAEIRYTKLQCYNENVTSIEGVYADCKSDARFYTNTFTFSGNVIRNNIRINIDGQNCEGHMHGLYLLKGKTHVDNNTTVDHRMPHSYSNELYKGILDENARGVFNGKIYVRPDAQKTNAFQSNNNILLAETATINTKPQLEIWADDVQCSHGCTTGQLDEDAIFYLQARGIPKNKAKALLLNAFANETLAELQNEIVREEIETLILNELVPGSITI